MMTQGPAFFTAATDVDLASAACAPETTLALALPAPAPATRPSAAIQTERPPRWSRGQGGGSFGNYQQRRQFFFDAFVRAETMRHLAAAAELAASAASVAGTATVRQPSAPRPSSAPGTAALGQPQSWHDWEFYQGEWWRRWNGQWWSWTDWCNWDPTRMP